MSTEAQQFQKTVYRQTMDCPGIVNRQFIYLPWSLLLFKMGSHKPKMLDTVLIVCLLTILIISLKCIIRVTLSGFCFSFVSVIFIVSVYAS